MNQFKTLIFFLADGNSSYLKDNSFKSFRYDKLIIWTSLLIIIYSFLIRLFNIWETFPYTFDNVEAWQYVQKSFIHLPKTGGRATGDAQHLGPEFFWILWFFRVTIGPFFHNMPHAGAIGVVFIRALSDGFIFYALAKRGIPFLLTLALVLFYTTFPSYLSLSRGMSNVDLSHVFINTGFALFILLNRAKKTKDIVFIVALLWIGVQIHMPSVIPFMGILISLMIEELKKQKFKIFLKHIAVSLLVIFILQIPYLYVTINSPPASHVSSIVNSISSAFSNLNFQNLKMSLSHILYTADVFYSGNDSILYPLNLKILKSILIVVFFLTPFFIRKVREFETYIIIFYSVSFISILLFMILTEEYQAYWMSSLIPYIFYYPLIIIIILLYKLLREKSKYLAIFIFLIILSAQPFRIIKSYKYEYHENKYYGSFVKGLSTIVKNKSCINEVKTDFPIKYINEAFVFMGGKKCYHPVYDAIIMKDGHVVYQKLNQL